MHGPVVGRAERTQGRGSGRLVAVDVEPPINEHLHCVACGYNLRGLQRDGDCPECGASIKATIENEGRYAEQAWIRQIADGALGAMAGVGAILLAVPGLALLRSWVVFLLPVLVLGGLVGLAGVWDLASRPRGAVPSRAEVWPGRWVRASLVILMPGTIILLASSSKGTAGYALAAAGMLMFGVLPYLLSQHGRVVSRRLLAGRFGEEIKWLGRAHPAVAVAVGALMVFPDRVDQVIADIRILGLAAVLLTGALWVWTISLLWRLRQAARARLTLAGAFSR